MEELKKSILESLDGFEYDLFPYLPYILQDLWAIGADPSVLLSLIKENIKNKNLKILDLGCGKGAVSISIAKVLSCNVKGIDALPEFIESAIKYAKLHHVNDRCKFEVADIRTKITELKGYDIVILGAIGPVFGNLYETLSILKKALNAHGYVLLVDGYVEDDSTSQYDRCLKKSDFYKQIELASYEIIQENLNERSTKEEINSPIFESIEKRVNELIIQHPEMRELFLGYLRSQEYENSMIENELVCGTWLLKLKTSKLTAYLV